MAGTLSLSIVRQFAGGPRIAAAFELALDRPSVFVLFGPSGSGKTTVLRCLAGLDRPDEGTIRCGDSIWFDSATQVHLPPQDRRIGYLFQDYAAFPHLTVRGNVGYGLRRWTRTDRECRVRELLDQFGLADLGDRFPRQLSGGQLQRVALARALAPSPRLLLLDEPLSALDAPLRARLRGELRTLLAAAGVPAILVTHDRAEAIALGDSMGVLVAGQLRQTGTVETVFGRPADFSVAQAVGVETVFPASVVGRQNGLVLVKAGAAVITAADLGEAEGPEVFLCIRAEEVALERTQDQGAGRSARNRLHGRVLEITAEGPLVRVVLDCGFPLTAVITRQAHAEMKLSAGDEVAAVVKATAVHLMQRTGTTASRARESRRP